MSQIAYDDEVEMHSDDVINSSDEYDTDMESESRFRKVETDKGMVSYREACDVLKIIPVQRVIACLEGNELQLNHRCLGPAGAKALAAALLQNDQVEILNLADNGLEGEGCIFIADMLSENSTITHLNLAHNNLGTLGALAVGDMLLANTGLLHLNLSDNHLKDSDAVHLVHGIDKNETVIHLDLSHNGFSEDGAVYLGRAIGSNNSIEELDLSWNQLRRNGAVAVCNGLKLNYCITIVDLSWNGLGYEGSMALGQMLKANKYLRVVDISNNRISWEGASFIADALRKNDTLEILRLGYNPLSMTGCVDIVEAVNNSRSVISYMGFDGIPINRKLLYMTEGIQKIRPFQITHGGLLDSEDIFGRRTVVKGDPLKLLTQFLSDKGIRPFDLFRTFDKDHQHRVSRDHFISGLKKAKVPLDDNEIDRVVNRLDSNKEGYLSYARLIHGVHEQIRQNWDEERSKQAEEKRKTDERERIMNRPLPPISETLSNVSHHTRQSLSKYRSERPSTGSSGGVVLPRPTTWSPEGRAATIGSIPMTRARSDSISGSASDRRSSIAPAFLPKLSLCSPLGVGEDYPGTENPKKAPGKKKKRKAAKKKRKKKKKA